MRPARSYHELHEAETAKDGALRQSTQGETDTTRVLIVGDLVAPAWTEADGAGFDIARLPFERLTREALDRIRPDLVLSALVGPPFDGLDLAERLTRFEFSGRYRAVAVTLPSPAMVRREVTASFPTLDFDILLLGTGPR